MEISELHRLKMMIKKVFAITYLISVVIAIWQVLMVYSAFIHGDIGLYFSALSIMFILMSLILVIGIFLKLISKAYILIGFCAALFATSLRDVSYSALLNFLELGSLFWQELFLLTIGFGLPLAGTLTSILIIRGEKAIAEPLERDED